jgi:DivIVA domain-containing protein
MELTPQQFIDAEFSEVRRGFDRDEVDAFLVKAAKGVEAMSRKITDLEARLATRPAEVPTDDMIARTLKLAQKAADDVLADARREADALRITAEREASEARTEAAREASRTLDDAHNRAAEAVSTAEAEAEAASDEARTRLRSEVVALEETRNRLRAELALLESHVASRHLQLVDAADQLRALAEATLVPQPLLSDEPPETAASAESSSTEAAEEPVLDEVPDLDASDPEVLAIAAAEEHAAVESAAEASKADASKPRDEEPEIPILDPDPTPSGGVSRGGVADEELASSFFEQGEGFRDERWKSRKERNRGASS